MEAAIRGEFSGLMQGMAGSALHGLIHLGYGFSASTPHMVCEGLAYLHHSYLPLVISDSAPDIQTLGRGSLDILEVVDKVRVDSDLRNVMLAECTEDWVTRRKLGEFQNKMVALLTLRGDSLVNYVHQIKFPDFSVDRLQAMAKWLLDQVITLYLAAGKRNDFFLLHGVTSTWALLQVLPLVNDSELIRKVVRVQLGILLAVYTVQDSPPLNEDHLKQPDVSELSWDDIKQKVLGLKPETDEHIFKLVQVCADTAQTNTDSGMDEIYKRACLSAMKYSLF